MQKGVISENYMYENRYIKLLVTVVIAKIALHNQIWQKVTY